ncbi:MAG: glycosyltransferase family 2 protein [Ignavibacterium sp.]|nr:glycosyltransferase family 2 protein [Ignavibacterium sp.]
MSDYQIVGIMLVRNEDVFIERAIRNIVDFCDRIIITDHQSTDRTFEICTQLLQEYPKIDARRIKSPRESAIAIEPYFGTNTWIFGVDGDEIYDPQGLKIMRGQLLEGAFARDWCIFGNVLNIISLNLKNMTAAGYLAPPSRPITKLYNFSLINGWKNCPERLHGDEVLFKEGFQVGLRNYLYREIPWDESFFRLLHMPFLTRSLQDRRRILKTRLNPDELLRIDGKTTRLGKKMKLLRLQLSQLLGLDWKHKKYRRGPLVEKDVRAFFPPFSAG